MPPTLWFREDGTFKIVQFTDMHWHNGDPDDLQTRALMERVLDAERPDLVMLTGDVIAGEPCRDPAESWRQSVAPMEERGLPWAAVFGNHDDEGCLSRAELMAVQQESKRCLSEPGPEEISGVGNYVLPILSARTGSLAAALYCLDSQSYAPPGLGGYGWVEYDQIGWYLAAARALSKEFAAAKDGTPLPALAFFHIPLPEYDEVWDFHACRGVKYENVCCPRLNTGLFSAFYSVGDVMGTFVGHDHVNDFEGTLHGLRLCYGRATGYNTYGRDGFPRGARVIQFREGERTFTTWLRLDDGRVVTEPPEHAPQGRVLTSDAPG
jgi:hypothetical protein